MEYNIKDLFYKYRLANDELKRIFELIHKEYFTSLDANPIEHIKFRIKKVNSIKDKLKKRNLEYNVYNIENNLTDVVGCRIVCSFLSDISTIKNVIKDLDKNNILRIVEERDYINNPKEESGYSSYHIKVAVPIFYNGEKTEVMAEIQLRTIAMDMSFSLEHKIIYKSSEVNEELKRVIRNVANFCRVIDKDLDDVVKNVEDDKLGQLSLDYPFMKRREFDLIRLKYESALRFLEEKFSCLYQEYDKQEIINPIEHIKCRLKRDDEIIRKLVNKKQGVNIENIEKHINDFAGIRVVCSFLNDIETLKNDIYDMADKGIIKIINEKDYVNNPKESGYSGYHFLVSVPLYTVNEGVVDVKVEIQLRTVAMEMWASLEEKICYNKTPSLSSREDLTRLAGVIGVFDQKLNDIVCEYNKISVDNKKLVLKR